MTKKKISIIVPVYNVKKYLKRCLESLQSQTYENIEIILVDDGSTDGCSKICDEYAKKDNRIVVIHQKNGGLSFARNTGVAKCTGDLILFVDSDDEILKNSCEELLKIYNDTKADLICFKNFVIRNDKIEPYTETNKIEIFDSKSAYEKYMLTGEISCCAWSRLYTKKLAQSVPFPVGVLSEDVATVRKFMFNAKKIVLYDKYLYKYFIRKNSIMGNKKQSHIIDIYNMNKDIYKFELQEFPEHEKFVNSKHLNILLKCYTELYYSENSENKVEVLNMIEKDILSFKNIRKMNFKTKFILNIFRVNKILACNLIINFIDR